MKFEARLALPVYPVLKAQTHEKNVQKDLTKIKHSSTNPESQSKESNAKPRTNAPHQQIN